MDVSKYLHEPCPCDKCRHSYKCDADELACRAFAYFVRFGRFEKYTARVPTKETFNKIFKEDDVALKNYLQSLRIKEEMAK